MTVIAGLAPSSFPAEAGIYPYHGHRPAPVRRELLVLLVKQVIASEN